jgi:hypothetical protein
MRNNSISSVYLSKCDLIHKFAITNINQCPEVDKVILQFSLKNLRENSSSNIEMNNQIKGVLMLYILLGLNSNIKYHSEKNVIDNYTKKNLSSYFSQNIILRNKDSIDKFINFLFVENDFKSMASTIGFKKIKTGESSVSLTINIPLSVFNDLNEFCTFSVKDLSPKDLTIQVSFFIKNIKDLSDKTVLSLVPFWHFG